MNAPRASSTRGGGTAAVPALPLLGRWAAAADEAAAAAARGDDDAVDAALRLRDGLCPALAAALAAAGTMTPAVLAAVEAASLADERLGKALLARRAALELELAGLTQQQLGAEAYQPSGAAAPRLDVTR